MERKLASVQRVKDVLPIEGADKIEIVVINGWQVVSKKGEFAKGSLVVYFEIDSWIPTEIAAFLSGDKEPREYKGVKGERLKTIRLRKQLSQGLVLPLSIVPVQNSYGLKVGDDLTEALGVLKWEPEEKSLSAQAGGLFPSFLRKTDQDRVQNIGNMLDPDEEFEMTVKKDGSSMTVFRVDPQSLYYEQAKALYKQPNKTAWQKFMEFFKKPKQEAVYGICSRNILLKLEGESNFHKAAKPVLESFAKTGYSFAIQGEVVAPDIQGNFEGVKEVEFHVFDIFHIDSQEYLLPVTRGIIAKDMNLKHVTVLGTNSLNILTMTQQGDDLVKKLLNLADGPSEGNGKFREGIVMKSTKRDFSFKCVSNQYLLKTGS